MSLSHITKVIELYVKNKRNDLLIIKGNWGVGKTFFWKNTVRKISKLGEIGHENYSYVSLFGIDSIETLKNSIVANQIKSISIGQSVNTSASVLISKLKNIAKFIERVPYIRNFSGGLASELAFQSVRDAVICFDDLERRPDNLEIKDILGIASLLKEERDCKVVLILNDEKLVDKDTFGEHNEKVVDIELLFSPTSEEVFPYVFDETQRYFDLIKTCVLKLEIKNVRILQRVKRNITELQPHLNGLENIVAEEIVRSIILIVWSYYNKDKPTIPIDFLRNFARINLYIREEIRKEEIDEKEKGYYRVLSDYGYDREDEVDKELIKFVETGYLGKAFFEALEQKNQQAIAQKGKDSYSEARDLYKTSFHLEESVFIEKLVSGFRANEKYLSVVDLYNMIDVIRKLGKDEVANSLIDEYVPKKIDYNSLLQMKQLPNFRDYKDSYFLNKLEQIPQPTITHTFLEAIDKILSDNHIYSDMIEFLSSCETRKYYEFFKNEESERIYWVTKLLLSSGESQTEHHQVIFTKTKDALLMIAKESEINRVRIKDWFNLEP